MKSQNNNSGKLLGNIENYYRLHSKIYDATRWSFLFGRTHLVKQIALLNHARQPKKILEVGCGTGKNLKSLRKYFPNAEITGVDLSKDMLNIAERSIPKNHKAVTLLNQAYNAPIAGGNFDLVVFSYALSMFNPGWDRALQSAYSDLAPGGTIAVVDFHDSAVPKFKRWMGSNHVEMEGHILANLQKDFSSSDERVEPAYGGVWRYFHFIGTKPGVASSPE